VAEADPRARVGELLGFALERLPGMRLEDGAFCNEVVAPGLEPRGRSLRYTLICLLGLQRAAEKGLAVTVDPAGLYELAVDEIDAPEVTIGDLGLLLWADARAERRWHDKVAFHLHRRIGTRLPDLEGLELGWVVIGAAEAGADILLDDAVGRQIERAEPANGLFRHHDRGLRARFPNFATQIYGVLALATAARHGRAEALAPARRAADRLLELQRPDGGWPWIFDAKAGRVVEPYEVYSVHQDAMAPMALHALGELSGDERYAEAALRGLGWVFGNNDLGREMLDHETGILYRSIRRRRGLDRAVLYANTAGALAGRAPFAGLRGPLEINPTDRPYHLGWVLEAWAGREPA
jgi:hypothetical protein